MSNREDFQIVADILNEWNIAEELEGTVLVGLRFSTIYLTDNGAFCDWMVSFTSTKKLQLEEAEKTRQESLADVFSGYDIEYSPEDYFIEVSVSTINRISFLTCAVDRNMYGLKSISNKIF